MDGSYVVLATNQISCDRDRRHTTLKNQKELPSRQRATIEDVLPENTRPSDARLRHFKSISCGFSFFVAGVNDGSLSTILPHVLRSYDIGTKLVSAVFACYIYVT
ncbi:hypothetical protein BGW36DRAFT_88375 [Talaromyces proteolyticus]|uniref:Uncharacterized protein n=1 Tax=Talaromyces proteolyticus TaxID=1131652 RepID=A0AAD4Q4W6_9EURO|nr:uncharacterized protein BGW36DRAFT_88375 [Talaromyces proteolyticus]KAH8703549.1 hypothetical protein BGW36DRAFT_88375 [Talaromyces proteolyticus]